MTHKILAHEKENIYLMEAPNENVRSSVDSFAKELAVAIRRILEINNSDSVELPKVVSEPDLQTNEKTGEQNG